MLGFVYHVINACGSVPGGAPSVPIRNSRSARMLALQFSVKAFSFDFAIRESLNQSSATT